MSTHRSDVLIIGGSGRSGSTLMMRVLGSLQGYFSVGELNHIWEQGIINNRNCGCGKPFKECEFWRAVIDEAFGDIEFVDALHLKKLRYATQRTKHLPLLAIPKLQTASFTRGLREYADAFEAVYSAIQKVSGCDVIVDSSKAPGHVFTVAGLPNVHARMIHLVRDSRATAYSWTRKKPRTDVSGAAEFMEPHHHFEMTMRWTSKHLFTHMAARRFDNYTLLRYEDFTASPRNSLALALSEIGLAPAMSPPFISDSDVDLAGDHSVWGNPDRSRQGVVTIRNDDEWKHALASSTRRQVTLLTLPLLVKYHYLPEHGTNNESLQLSGAK